MLIIDKSGEKWYYPLDSIDSMTIHSISHLFFKKGGVLFYEHLIACEESQLVRFHLRLHRQKKL
nr:MAG TPA: hypothetical protein [Caudoviricetes sp.]